MSLIYLLVSHLKTAHYLYSFLSERARSGILSRMIVPPLRPMNKPARQSGLNFVIDACRDTLEVLMQSNLEIAHGLIQSFQGSDIPLLRRFAIYGWTERSDVSSEDRLTWLLGENLVWDFLQNMKFFDCELESFDRQSKNKTGVCCPKY